MFNYKSIFFVIFLLGGPIFLHADEAMLLKQFSRHPMFDDKDYTWVGEKISSLIPKQIESSEIREYTQKTITELESNWWGNVHIIKKFFDNAVHKCSTE